jgi:AmpD protein
MRDPWIRPGWLGAAKRFDSPHFDLRPADSTIDLLVVHHISLPPGQFIGTAVEDLFMGRLDPSSHPAFRALQGLRVSSHFFIRRSGELLQFVSCDQRAWHAGVSVFRGRQRCNDFSIGVELEGDGLHPFTQAQYRRLYRLVPALITRYPLRFITGHENIAPGRKQDPGPTFQWGALLEALAPYGLQGPSA